jgi:hypothetical protein
MDEDLRDVDLLVAQRLRGRAHVVLAQPDLQDLPDVGGEREAEKIFIFFLRLKKFIFLSTAEKIIFFLRGKKSSFFSEDQ